MNNRKFGIWSTVMACCILAMVISCDSPTENEPAKNAPVEKTEITSFRIGQDDGVINEKRTPKTITLTVPYGTDLASLVPTVSFTGLSVSPESEIKQDFTDSVKKPIVYTVTGRDNSSVEYQVSVNTADGTGIVINVNLEEDSVASTPSVTTIYKNGNPTSATIEAVKGISCKWLVDGKLWGTSNEIKLESYNLTTGDHFVTLITTKNGIPFSKEFIITVIKQFR